MKIKYLGTAAAEGVPALFCNCNFCNYARQNKGKEIRNRAQAVIDGNIMIDFGPDTYSSARAHGIDLSAIGALLITHTHSDHFAPFDLFMRGGCYAHNMTRQQLTVYCGKEGEKAFYTHAAGHLAPEVAKTITVKTITPFEPFKYEDYSITFLPANHKPDGEAFIISVKSGDKGMLYCNDTGQLPEKTYDYLKASKTVFDFIAFDCTHVGWEADAKWGHMGFEDIKIVEKKLTLNGQITPSTKKAVTHFSHNALIPYEQLEEKAASYGYTAAYDGIEYTF